ncbi:MAG: hypothetical protein N4J56_005171 [Chroococcidiopsis sp. SAG 2025]|nr:hypothetical protein [Chroococcidiopsis sp. SAG 2025]
MYVLLKANKQLNRSILGLRKQISWLNFASQEDTAWINVLVIFFSTWFDWHSQSRNVAR